MSYGKWVHESIMDREIREARDRAAALRVSPAHQPVPGPEACPCWSPARWPEIKDAIRAAVTDATWNIWLCSVHPHRMDDGQLVLGCDLVAAGWVRSRFARVLSDAAGGPVVVVPCAGGLA